MPKKRVVFYLIDGARPDILQKLMANHKLPNIQKHLVENGSYTKGTTCYPSTTGPAYLPYLTGHFPGAHDITGIRWFDKKEYFKGRWGRNAMRSYCGYEANFFNEDMHDDKPSLFEEYEQGFNIYNMITKGVKAEHDLTQKAKSGLYLRAHFKHEHHAVDRAGHQKMMDALDQDFDFIFSVFPSIDWDSHTYHFDDPKTCHKAYEIVDQSLGEVLAKLKKKKLYEDTLLIMASDHGLSSTHTHLDLGKFFKANRYRVLEYPSIWTLFPQVAVFISGNSFATLSFLDRKELYYQAELIEKHHLVLQKLVVEDAIDFILFRKDDSNVVVMNDQGTAEISFKDSKVAYKSVDANPLRIDKTNGYINETEAFHHTFDSDYPDALIQIKQLFESRRSGDIVVNANIGYDLRDFWEIPEHKGSHGSLHREHMHIPILTNKPNMLNHPIRSTAVHEMIKDWLDS